LGIFADARDSPDGRCCAIKEDTFPSIEVTLGSI